MRKPTRLTSPLDGDLLTALPLVSWDALRLADLSRNRPGPDGCSHNVLTRMPGAGGADRRSRGHAAAPGGVGDVFAEREPGGESAAEAVACAGRIDDVGVCGRHLHRLRVGSCHQRAVAAQLDHHAFHPGVDEFGSSVLRFVIARQVGQLFTGWHEHIDQPGGLQHVRAALPVLVRPV